MSKCLALTAARAELRDAFELPALQPANKMSGGRSWQLIHNTVADRHAANCLH